MGSKIAGLVKEPFVHFLLLGGLIFAAYAWANRGQQQEDRIVIDQASLDHLKKLWEVQWKRMPSDREVGVLVDRHVRQEVFYREALQLGLDRNDEIIRKRLSQKMEAVANDLGTLMRPPTEERLQAYFVQHPDLFRLPRAYAFRQVLFLPDEAGGKAAIEAALARLREGADIPADRRSMLSIANKWSLTSAPDLDNAFGGDFARALDALPVRQWSGPVRSGLGWHLVFIDERADARVPAYEDVKDYVAREYAYRAELDAQDRAYRELLGKYRVVITARDVPAAVRKTFDAE